MRIDYTNGYYEGDVRNGDILNGHGYPEQDDGSSYEGYFLTEKNADMEGL